MKMILTKKEFCVVLICIFVLVMTLGAVGRRGRKHARFYICQSNLKTMQEGHAAHWDTTNSLLLMGYGENHWTQVISSYMEEFKRVFLCPEADSRSDGSLGYGTATEPWGFEWGFDEIVYGSYGMNAWLTEDVYGWFTNDEQYYESPYNIDNPSLTPVFADAFWTDSWPMDIDSMPSRLEYLIEPLSLPHAAGTFMWRFCVDRHDLAVNAAFVDGHVERVPIVDLWTLKWNRTFEPRYDKELPEF